jgi:hypothetical protein
VSRLVRAVRLSDVPGETVLVLGGRHGAVALHVMRQVPCVMVLHSPEEAPDWTGPERCRYLEGPCWWLGSVTGTQLAESLSLQGATGEECDELTWKLMGDTYLLYLERGRR